MACARKLLEQADALLTSKYAAAATTTAGGAGCTPAGAGSITNYRDALNAERKAGNGIISAADADETGAWGKKRNEAAHDPGAYQSRGDPRAFTALCKDVERTIEGIRQFVARTSGT